MSNLIIASKYGTVGNNVSFAEPREGYDGVILSSAPVSSAPLSPPLTGNIGWWKADSISAEDLSSVSIWNDSSGNDYHVTQSLEWLQPTYMTDEINGYPAIRFADKYFQVPDIFSGVTEAEIFGVVKIDLDPPVAVGRTGLWQFGGTGERMHFPYTDSTIYDNFCTSPRKTVGNPTPSLTEWRLYNVKSATNNWSSSIDGVTLYSTATNTPVFTGLRHIGLSRNTLGDNLYYLWGYIAEIIIYNRLVDATERSQINTYFSTKYGLTLS